MESRVELEENYISNDSIEVKKSEAITLNKNNFSNKIQESFEKYYLKPMDDSVKKNLKDGYIERNIHGAMHAARATLWSLMMNNVLQEIAPDYVKTSLEKIARYLNTDIEHIQLIVLITVACHDAARKGESQDHWEVQSGDITAEILKEIGLNENQAKLFAKAVTFKDKREEYFSELKKLNIDEKDYNAFDYIRKLVNLGDNLDLMRCVNPFKSKYIFDTLKTVEGFDEAIHHDVIMKFIIAIHQFIYDQHDMRFKCDIRNTKNEIVGSLPCRLSNKEKVKYEHADNVFAVLFEEVSNNPIFQAYISDFTVPHAKKYEEAVAFDPFVHGTNSSIFSMLPKTNFQILPILTMLEDFQVAPMSGELTRGGYNIVGTTLVKEENIGRTSFARMTTTGYNSYTLEKVLSGYTSLKVTSSDTSLEDFKYALSLGLRLAFANINLILIYFTRARQTHASLEEVISSDALIKLQTDINATTQFFYFIQLLGEYIHPNFNAIKESGLGRDVSDAGYTLLTFEYIVNKITENKLDMKAILDNPTHENLLKALTVLEFPKKCTIKSGYSGKDKEVEFQTTQFFCLEPDYTGVKKLYENMDNLFSYFQQNYGSGATIHEILEKFLSKRADRDFFEKLSKKAQQHIIILNDRVRLFQKLVETPQSQFTLTEDQKYFLKQSIPIIIISEAEDKILLHDNHADEYRSVLPLKLGDDITMFATDTYAHRLEIVKFLEQYHIDNVQVVLFNDLKMSKVSKKAPKFSEPVYNQNDASAQGLFYSTISYLKDYLFYKPKQTCESVSDSLEEKRIKSNC